MGSIYLDTHVVVWLYAGRVDLLSKKVLKLINSNDLYISPLVELELQYLFEIARIKVQAKDIVDDLRQSIGLQIASCDLSTLILSSLGQDWTRDVFDRIIVTQAAIKNDILLTKDKKILQNYPKALW